jgi:hypothetical protein
MPRLASDLLLLIAPFGLLSAAFFLGEQPKFGIAFILVTLAAIVYVRPWQRPQRATSDDQDANVAQPADSAGVGKAGGPV